MKKYLVFSLVLFLFIGCNFNKTYQNRESDRQDAEKITNEFYSLLNNHRIEKAFELFSNKFFQVTSKEKLKDMIDWTNANGGKVKKISLSNWQTLVNEGDTPIYDYSLTYYIERDSINTQEIFSLQKEYDTIKIVGYKINLDVQKNE